MKGVKNMCVATGSAKKFNADDIITTRVHLPNGVEVSKALKELSEKVKDLEKKNKDLEDKYNSLETE